MQFYSQFNKGFIIDHELADEFGILDEFLIWEEENNEMPLFEVFEEKFGLRPDKIKYFEYEKDGCIKDLQGFVYDNVYILFDEFVEESSQEEWDELTIFLEEHDIVLDEGSWSELR